MPAWLETGVGEVFACARAERGGDKLVFDKKPAETVAALKELVGKKALPSFASLLALGGGKRSPEEGMALWGVARMLLTGTSATTSKLLPAFAKALRDGKDPDKARQEVFGAVEAKELEAAWSEFVKGL